MEENKTYRQQYYENNKEKFPDKAKNYYEKNKESLGGSFFYAYICRINRKYDT